MTYSTLNNMEAELEAFSYLIRVHKSFMVNKNFIIQLDNNIIKLHSGSEMPLGASYRDHFINNMRII